MVSPLTKNCDHSGLHHPDKLVYLVSSYVKTTWMVLLDHRQNFSFLFAKLTDLGLQTNRQGRCCFIIHIH